MYTITPFAVYIILLGYMGWPLTLIATAMFAYLGYCARAMVWRIVLWGIAAVLGFPLLYFWWFVH